ncbi:hypothetical protein P153DRAFT_353290 [Dothidotthia symphoricarpi CBS 119687]|uniref:Uncharacterized protein n=1 Tax=Dothidotthia symphoricarpi CBS 119687 TaxID=1392245 RepID=A0A6A6ARC3_9PLEO|nr:uncharacterized protein P153DRAFT_353290 [Dothidotthia symphoricarpi CBS 119687]KAF2134086.1 hypothetical protein P153DRAFT_353290 [Dothidotthia symphoricarpi CBS 119687]
MADHQDAATISSSGTAPVVWSNSIDNNGQSPLRELSRGLYAPALDGGDLPDDSLSATIRRLMSPPQGLYSADGRSVTLYINWAVGVVGVERFEPTPLARRLSLRQDDALRERGVSLGLSKEILEWLRQGEEMLTLPASHFT